MSLTKTVVALLSLTLLIGAFGSPDSGWGAAAAALYAVAGDAPGQAVTVAPPDDSPPWRFDHISGEQGLSNSEVWSVLRDRRGFMWFGTLDGLNRYDGYKMKVFKHTLTDPSSLSDNKIRTVYEDRAGALWIGTWDGGLNRYERESETFTRYQHDPEDPASLSSDSVFAILEDRAGALWLGTRGGGLNRFDPASGVFSHYRHDPAQPTSLGNDNVFALWDDQDGALWVGTDGGLDRLDPTTGIFTHYRHNPDDPASLSHDTIRALFEDASGALWIGTWGGGLDRLDRTTGTFTHYRADPYDPRSLSFDGVFSIHQDAMGALWVGTVGGGLNQLDLATGVFRRFGLDDMDPSGFSASQIVDVFGDADTEWFATGNGVFALDLQPKPFRVFQHDANDANSLANNEIDAIYEDPQGILWVATASSGLNRIDRATGQVTHYRHDPADPASLGGNDIWSIAPSRDGQLWLAATDSGLSKFDPATGQSVHYRSDPDNSASLGSDRATAVLEDQSGIVWVGTWDAGVDRFDPATGTFTHYVHDPADPTSLSDNAIFALVEDRNGHLWIGTTNGGLNRFEQATGTFTRYQGEPGNPQRLPSNSITSVLLDRAGALWVGTWGGGLARLDPDTGEATDYDHDNGLPSDAIFGILEDEMGRLWLSTGHGLSRFDPRTETFRNYDEQDGLPGNVFESAVSFQSPSGEMFFGATNGLLAFYPEQIQDNLAVPPVVITDFLLANKPVAIGQDSVLQQAIDETDALTLSYLDRVISFEFAALDYASPQKNRYRYMLEGFDEAWTEVGSDRRLVTYTSLEPGKYVFRVLGSSADGIWNEAGAALALTITPPWWQSLWFRVASILLVVGLIGGSFVQQRRRAGAQQAKLEAMVAERTKELQDAHTQISTLFNNSPLGIAVATLEGKVLGVNQAMQRMSGYSEDELLQSDVTALYAYPDQRVQLLKQLSADGFLSNFGILLRRRDGSHYFASMSLSQLEMAGQTVVLGVTEDVTDHVEARQALTTLHQMSYDMASITDLPTLIDHAVPHLSEIVDFQRAALMLVDDGDRTLTIHTYLSPSSPPELAPYQVLIDRWQLLRSALTGRETTHVPDMQASEAIQAELDGMQSGPWADALKASRSWLGLPLVAGERTIGLLNLLHSGANHFDQDDIDLARTFANQLAIAIDNLRLKEQTAQTAAADERSRIARDLHDSVTQTLFTASMLAEATPRIWNKDRDIARQNMERLSLLIRGALAEMRSMLLELRSDALPNQNLEQLITALAEGARVRSAMAVSLAVQGECELPLSGDVSLTFYRIAQEALNNVIKHAEATQVDIALLCQPDRVALHIRDDGRGFDPQQIPDGHLGISIMAERARKIGADLTILSIPGRGSEVRLIWQKPAKGAAHV